MEENKKGKNNKKIIIGVIIGIIIVALIGVIVFLGLQLNKNQMNNNNNENSNIQDENKENNANNASKNTTKVNTLSFKQMEYNDNSLTEDQKIIAKYFDEDYFFLNTYEELVRYADMLKNINVSCYGQVNSIVSSEGENFEAVCQWGSAYDSFWGVENAELT